MNWFLKSLRYIDIIRTCVGGGEKLTVELNQSVAISGRRYQLCSADAGHGYELVGEVNSINDGDRDLCSIERLGRYPGSEKDLSPGGLMTLGFETHLIRVRI